MSPEITKICKKLLPPLKNQRETLFNDNQNVFNKKTSKICTEQLGLTGGASQFRKVTFQSPEAQTAMAGHDAIQEIADIQGHSIPTIQQHYL